MQLQILHAVYILTKLRAMGSSKKKFVLESSPMIPWMVLENFALQRPRVANLQPRNSESALLYYCLVAYWCLVVAYTRALLQRYWYARCNEDQHPFGEDPLIGYDVINERITILSGSEHQGAIKRTTSSPPAAPLAFYFESDLQSRSMNHVILSELRTRHRSHCQLDSLDFFGSFSI